MRLTAYDEDDEDEEKEDEQEPAASQPHHQPRLAHRARDTSGSAAQKKQSHYQHRHRSSAPVPVLALASALAVLLPLLTFPVIPVFLGRMAVVALVAGGIAAGLLQRGVVAAEPGNDIAAVKSADVVVVAGVYGAVMCVLAGLVG